MGAMWSIRGLLAGALVLLATVGNTHAVDAKDFILRDRKAFLMGLKLARPGLAGVKAALARGNVDAAGEK
ncbi:MAG: hypothetical protein QGD94_08275, partial [Planctomycetia bacterium]|nr:hypothetical protein [Planctomycetia bacterium]